MSEMHAAPDVSVIIAAYNVAAYITRAIESALSQEGVNVEVIVVDDLSTDATAILAEAIVDRRVQVIRQPHNGGPSVARNVGVALARGTSIAVLDGDDAFEAGRLARCLTHAHADIVVDNLLVYREVDGMTVPMFTQAFGKNPTLGLADFIAGNQQFLGGYTLGYLKPIFSAAFLKRTQLCYDPSLRIGEDYMLMAQALAMGAVCAVESQAGYRYTVRAGSISHRITASDVERITKADERFMAHYVLPPEVMAANRQRLQCLREAFAYSNLMAALKTGNVLGAGAAVISYPMVVRQLWRPLLSRIERWQRRIS